MYFCNYKQIMPINRVENERYNSEEVICNIDFLYKNIKELKQFQLYRGINNFCLLLPP